MDINIKKRGKGGNTIVLFPTLEFPTVATNYARSTRREDRVVSCRVSRSKRPDNSRGMGSMGLDGMACVYRRFSSDQDCRD